MRNVLLKIQYDGSAFHGFQVQKNAVSVQQTLQDAIAGLFGDGVTVTGCSRTDAGVHALCYYALAAFDGGIATENIPQALNTKLPEQIAVLEAADVPQGFHPRYDVECKTYIYRIFTARCRSPFESGRSWHYPYRLDDRLMDRCAAQFVGKKDFSAFMASGSGITDAVRTVFSCGVKREGDIVTLSITADGFLYNMVRIIAGTLVDIGSGRIEADRLETIIEGRDRRQAGQTAPPQGLYLKEVKYRKETAAFYENK